MRWPQGHTARVTSRLTAVQCPCTAQRILSTCIRWRVVLDSTLDRRRCPQPLGTAHHGVRERAERRPPSTRARSHRYVHHFSSTRLMSFGSYPCYLLLHIHLKSRRHTRFLGCVEYCLEARLSSSSLKPKLRRLTRDDVSVHTETTFCVDCTYVALPSLLPLASLVSRGFLKLPTNKGTHR